MLRQQALLEREHDAGADEIEEIEAARAAHGPAVERVIVTMRERLGETLTLHDLAGVAHLSPFYFTRVFRDATGIPPAEYLAALRLQEAKRLLLTADASVTEACYAVGYSGLGTFAARFARLVGVPPGRLRRQAEEVDRLVAGAQPFGGVTGPVGALDAGPWGAVSGMAGVCGTVHAPDATPGLIFIGLFPTPIPQAAPIGSALLDGPGTYHIPSVPDGCYYAMAAGFPAATRGLAYLLPDDGLRVGRAPIVVTVRAGRARERADITLRPPRPTAPPLLVALPFLLADRQRPDLE